MWQTLIGYSSSINPGQANIFLMAVCSLVSACVRWFGVGFRQRPYFVEYTRSHPNSEVKRRKARSVLGWGTAREALRVLLAFSIFQFSKQKSCRGWIGDASMSSHRSLFGSRFECGDAFAQPLFRFCSKFVFRSPVCARRVFATWS